MDHDLLIIGGGINGCAIAREAALLGLSVLLVERDDLASHTSSASTKLIHGGLRYLEYYDFRLVAEALHERERLLKAAPHLTTPLQFVLPQRNAVRPWWMVRAGLLLYDLLGGRSSLPRSRGLGRGEAVLRQPLHDARGRGFVYWDAAVDDSRLTLANATDAAANGATIATRTALEAARRIDGGWRATLSDGRDITARALANAAGPWVDEALGRVGVAGKAHVRLVKGSHIVVPRLYAGDHAYLLQQPDRRIVFAIPYQGEFTAIGTTDVPVATPADAVIDDAEIAYLCDAANAAFFSRGIRADDVVSSWSGVRPLYDDGASEAKAVTRDYVLELDDAGAPLLSIFGGKITIARHLAEQAMATLAPLLGVTPRQVTRDRMFQVNAVPGRSIEQMVATTLCYWPFLGEPRARRMTHAYGVSLGEMLDGIDSVAAMGEDFGAGLTEVELTWMREREWATTVEDALMRRSKLGLHLTPAQIARVEQWWAAHG